MPDQPIERTSNWANAVRQLEFDALVCPRCGAANRPRCHYITIGQDGRAECAMCAAAWTLHP